MWNHSVLTTMNQTRASHQNMTFRTEYCLEFVDITSFLDDYLQRCGIASGIVNIQSQHTTAAILVNENEPLLLSDIRRMLERLAPQELTYLHNDFSIRTVNMTDQEDQNGHSHCKAIFLPTSQMLNFVDGKLALGKWQRVFLLELDCSRERTISIMTIGI